MAGRKLVGSVRRKRSSPVIKVTFRCGHDLFPELASTLMIEVRKDLFVRLSLIKAEHSQRRIFKTKLARRSGECDPLMRSAFA